MSKILMAAILLAMGSWVTACNTTKGMGEDIEATGEAVQDAAKNTSDSIKKK